MVDHNGNIENKDISDKISNIRMVLTKNPRQPKVYSERQALYVAKRIEEELKNPNMLQNRVRNELIVEQLLNKHRFYSKINKVYRLSDDTLIVLRKRLE